MSSQSNIPSSKKTALVFNFLINVIQPFYWQLSGLVFVALFWAIDLTLRPYLIKLILDTLAVSTPQNVFEKLMFPIGSYIALSLISILIFRLVYDTTRLKLYPILKKNIIMKLMDHVMVHSYKFYQNTFAGSLTNKIKDVADGSCELIEIVVDRFLASILAMTLSLYALYQVNTEATILMGCFGAIYLGIALWWAKVSRQISDKLWEYNSRLTGKIVDVLSNIASVRFFTGHTYEKGKIDKWTTKKANLEKNYDLFFLKVWLFQGMLFIAAQILILIFLMRGYQLGLISIGDFAFVLSLNISIIDCLWRLATEYGDFIKYLGRVDQGLRMTISAHEINDRPNAETLKIKEGAIKFDDVSFHHTGPGFLFNKLSIEIQPHEKVGLVGYSGSGKTTFINLLLRLFDIQEGRILIDNQDIALCTQESVRKAIAVMPQEPALFNRTLLENIRYGRLDATEEEVIEAAKKARAHDFILQLEKGYATEVGERGAKLSGGQRQRVAIARAILKDAPIVILDEATSALDSITEKEIQESLKQLMYNKTTLVIAHRLSTLLEMDRILVFDKGKIIESGPPQELINKNGLYKQLWEAQLI